MRYMMLCMWVFSKPTRHALGKKTVSWDSHGRHESITRGLPLEFYRRPCHIGDGAKPCETNQGLMFGDIYLGFCLLAWRVLKLWRQVYPVFFVLGQHCRIYRKPLISNCFNMEYWMHEWDVPIRFRYEFWEGATLVKMGWDGYESSG